MANVLVVVAHADDEVLGCGATIAKHSMQGDDVTLLVMTDGVSARVGEFPSETNGKNREQALRKASGILGINRVHQADFPDNKMDSVDLLAVIRFIEENTRGIEPEIIYTHSLYDLNVDHRLTAQAVLTAFRPVPDCSVKTILSFEVPSSTEWQFGDSRFCANWFVDVSEYLDKKMEALRCYQTEMHEFPHPRSYVGVEALSQLRGVTVGKTHCEAFQLLRHSV